MTESAVGFPEFFSITRTFLRSLGITRDKFVENDRHSVLISGFSDDIYVSLRIIPSGTSPHVILKNLRAEGGIGTSGGRGTKILRNIEAAARRIGLTSIDIEHGTSFWTKHPEYTPVSEDPITHRRILSATNSVLPANNA